MTIFESDEGQTLLDDESLLHKEILRNCVGLFRRGGLGSWSGRNGGSPWILMERDWVMEIFTLS